VLSSFAEVGRKLPKPDSHARSQVSVLAVVRTTFDRGIVRTLDDMISFSRDEAGEGYWLAHGGGAVVRYWSEHGRLKVWHSSGEGWSGSWALGEFVFPSRMAWI